MKRLVPTLFVALMCAVPLTPLARSGGTGGATRSTPQEQGCVADGSPGDVRTLTAAERETLLAAEQTSSPALEEMRGGSLVVALLLIILIIVLLT